MRVAPKTLVAGMIALALDTASFDWPREARTAGAAPTSEKALFLDGRQIRYSADYAKRSRLAFASVERSLLSPVLNVTGTVTFDPERVAAVGARIPGRIRRLCKLEGDTVHAGDVLAEIESAELGKAQARLVAARARADSATVNERREKQLAKAGISSTRDAELAEDNAIRARAELFAAEQRVHAMGGLPERNTFGVLSVRTPIDGKIIERNVWRGQRIEPTHTVFRVADLSRVWVELAVFERQIAAIRPGDRVDLSPASAGSMVLGGVVDHIGDVIDVDTRTAPVRVVVDHPPLILRPGQSVLARIHSSVRSDPSLLVPQNSVTNIDGKRTVFVYRAPDGIEPRTVQVGGHDDKLVEILSGLQAGEDVATSGVMTLTSNVFRQ
ncbi:MAG TPA: efflux RND transporter periplasmic adaptor subunit [Polyangiaceae bacterium]|nr:efflux RND transporter periplasmic adaptor subunit [Polyangiaceae bacterium]